MNVEEVLREFNIKHTRGLEWFKVKCPFHNDSEPSGSINHKTGFFTCFACGKKTSLILFICRDTNLPIYQVKRKIGIKSDCKNPIAPTDVELDHNAIWDHPTFLDELRKRCVTDDLIRQYRIGVKLCNGVEKRVTIPIINDVGEVANLRLYLPGAKSHKFLNTMGKDRSKIRFHPVEQLEFDQILVCAGELKAIAATKVLNPHDVGAIAPTCGELAWPTELNERLYGKLIYVCSDDDDTGEKSAEQRCRILSSFAREIHKVTLPHDLFEKHGIEKGDINDFLRLGGDLYQLLLDSPEWKLVPGGEVQDDLPLEVDFREAYKPEHAGKRVKFTSIVAGFSGNNYLAPASVAVKCTRDQEFCMLCDVNSKSFGMLGEDTEMKIGKEHPALLAIIGEREDRHYEIYKNCFNIPRRCRVCTFHPKEKYAVTEVRLEEQTAPTSRSEPLTMKIGFIVNGPTTLDHQTYNLTGRLYPAPRNQLSSFLISECEPTLDALDAYRSPTDEYFDIFRPKEWTLEAVEEKLNDIYDDYEANVTKIYQRRDYHIAVDLVYHSVLHFDFNGITNINAYLEMLAVGDTEQGKSQITDSLHAYYGLGSRVDCKAATLPGLTIGLEKSVNKHFAVYGVMPRNDRGLVIFEELKGMNPKVFQALTEIRSSGYVQITKIEQKQRRSRCRLIAISNPIGERDISSYAYGIEAALGIIGTNEDLRRFDFVNILSKSDIDADKLTYTLKNPPQVPNKYDAEHCQRLVLKAWKCESVEFEDTQFILSSAKELAKIYGDGPPVLGQNSSHIKVAKMSAALAARTCSYGEDGRLIVRKCHTEFIVKYLHRIYSSPSARLDEKSKQVREGQKIKNKEELIKYICGIANSKAVMTVISETDVITSAFLKDLCGDFMTGGVLFSKLIQSNALIRANAGSYTKSPEFMELLNEQEFPDYEPPKFMR